MVQVVDLVHRCWEHQPEARPTMTEVGTELDCILADMHVRVRVTV